MDSYQAVEFLSQLESDCFLRVKKKLTQEQQNQLLIQLKTIDFTVLQEQKKLIKEPQTKERVIQPISHYSLSGNSYDKENGKKIIASGRVGCLIVAGGQGSRLKIQGPKGICAVTKIRKKSLFQLFAEKTLAAGHQANCLLPLGIMTSPLNHNETIDFFENHSFFGLNKNQVSFFQQQTLPLLNEQGDFFLESFESISKGPDGNGSALHQFVNCGLWEKWNSMGIKYLNVILIDNALADPFDAELIGFQNRQASDIVVKCAKRKNVEDSVGILVKENGKVVVIEYTELSQNARRALNEDGSFYHPLANLSLFSFKMDFIKRITHNTPSLLHKAFKAVKFLNPEGKTVMAEQAIAWKFEKFIFDFLPLASKVDILVYPQQMCFAPLKNFGGKDSFETVANAIEFSDQQILSSITNRNCSVFPLEIAQDFYYPTDALVEKWKNHFLPINGYVKG